MRPLGRASAITTVVLAVFFVFLGSSACLPADLSEVLEQRLASASDDESISVLVFMREQVDIFDLQARYKPANFTRQAMHKIVIEELKSHSEFGQRDIIPILNQGLISGEVQDYESYWIANVVKVAAHEAFIEILLGRTDIEIIVEDMPPQSLYYPRDEEGETGGSHSGAGVAAGLEIVGADSMWTLGYTGEGSLIGSFDSGVQGDHPALQGSYRGNNGYSARESWFDPVFGEAYPHYEFSIGQSYAHGTSTLGVMVGKNDDTGDTTGIAFDAQWIAAMIVDVPGANYLQAFQWAADPDGDPSTIDDVPDVLNNSWGFTQDNLGCLDIFWSAMDNLEALGTVVVFACGNEGNTGAYSLRNPANRASTEFMTFSVGAVDPNTSGYDIWGRSSRGPSDCDSISKKPEVVAPGVDIRTTTINGSYTNSTGTSYAAPHVSGAVALLRQVNPNATVNEIKAALMNSAIDLGEDGEDNTYGWGLIDIPAAMQLLPPNDQVNIYIQSVDHDSILPGDTFDVYLTLKNSGKGTVDVVGTMRNPDPAITIIDDIAGFGTMGMGQTVPGSAAYRLYFDSAIPDGVLLDVDLEITAGDGYSKIVKVYFSVGEKLVKSAFTHNSDSCSFTISNYGTYGLAPNSIVSGTGSGFTFPATGGNNLFQCGLLIGVDSTRVSDGIVNLIGSVDDDFNIAVEGNLMNVSPGVLGDVETFSRFCDSNAVHPIGITIEQRTASCYSGGCASYVICEYAVRNASPETLTDLYVGMYFDWDFPFGSGSYDRTGFSRPENLGYMWDAFGTGYRGTAVLSDEGVATYFAIPNEIYVYHGVSEVEKYMFLSRGITDTASLSPYDQSYCISSGPFALEPGMSDTVAFAVIGANDLGRLRQAAANAIEDYRAATPVTESDDVLLPESYALEQNYPNPFNPETNIAYTVLRPGRITIEVFNLVGQRVVTLLDQYQPAGNHLVRWDGADERGNPVASGVYLYRMKAEGFSSVKKMLLLK